ncbi:MAG: glycoside hydrolase family 3 C-terminal domain-containing protein [Pseudomonadota bacterium]
MKLLACCAAVLLCFPALAATQDPDQRAASAVAQMTEDEKIRTVFGYFSAEFKGIKGPKEGRPDTAGFIYGTERLGVPPQWLTDAGIGVSGQPTATARARTSLPSGLATAASWNPELAYQGGAMIGNEARLSGHNVLLAGSVNLMREPRNGRNFEYAGEDPLLAGVMAGEFIRGIQSNHIISTVKHFAYNDQETNRGEINVKIGDAAGRMSDLLAFQIAIARGNPGAVMCAYNRVNGDYACESDYLLNKVLKGDWGYRGYVMSDWGATHSTIPAANRGLDQQSGWPFDHAEYFNAALKEAVENGHVPQARLDDMAHRIVRTMFANGLMDHPLPVEEGHKIDFPAHALISQADAEEGMVLLKNAHALLPLAPGLKTVAIIGGHADVGVLTGGGSAQVYPQGGSAVPNEGPTGWPGPTVYNPSSPMKALAARSKAKLVYHDGKDAVAAAKLAAASDVAIVFATQWTAESIDVPDLSLPDGQDALIAKVAAANPNTVVVLETGGPVTMPWLDAVGAVVEAWYPGTAGGEAIARVLSGEVNPSGRLPATFPRSESQLPRPRVDGDPAAKPGGRYSVDYNIEGAAVGYKWFELKGHTPLFAFGHGLSYTSFAYQRLAARPTGDSIVVEFKVSNTGKREGKAVAQVYVGPAAGGWEAPRRLGGWEKVALKRGASRTCRMVIDPRLLAMYDSASGKWNIAAGDYIVTLASASDAPAASVTVTLAAREVGAGAH